MGLIQVLDEHIANQIAAGEVVERPSSVVKELVENSVDAGSTVIDVTIEEGGLAFIRVSDNGSGIGKEDCETAFERHATSKIASGKDLFQIRTLGFRGEALPSIAAVSKVELISSAASSGLGRRIVIEGGKRLISEDAAASKGTEFTVRELFFNTPARLKYMKTIQTELGHISDFMYRLALAHPGISFSLKHNGSLLIQTLGNGDVLQVIAAIYGKAAAKAMLPVEAESLDYQLKGYISSPELTRSNRNGITTLVNGRYIKNYGIVNAMLRAYHTLLPINRYPLAVLDLQMHPTLVDVNVHPAKLEVRFSKDAELSEFLEQTLARTLKGKVLIPGAGPAPKVKSAAQAVVQEQLELYRTETASAAAAESVSSRGREVPARTESGSSSLPLQRQTSGSFSDLAKSLPSWEEVRYAPAAPKAFGTAPNPSAGFNGGQRTVSGPRPDARSANPDEQPEVNPAVVKELLPAMQPPAGSPQKLPVFPELHPIGQMHGTYIVAQNDKGLYLIDQHAAHERINYEYYYERFGNPQPASQELLLPITLDFTPSDAQMLKEKLHLFEQAGVIVEHFGGNTFVVRSYPYWFPQGDEQSVIEEMADWILTERKGLDIAKIREKSAILCSCKASIKANQSLTNPEIEKLLERLGKCTNPYTCPHGRPIIVSFSTYELEKMFKRVM
ncbi:DNA mismatch repair endonuclease MutL [Paenibacillus gansuensis]|uniref:DNA mismatch repair protein MutL n=1 Tax=Paenibacillus gansuensis TaxID=306542 RepID=A0ABW5PCT4_9BACL